jgi:transcription elongation factor SPT6
MARRVEELMAHEKFKHGSEDDLRVFLCTAHFVYQSPNISVLDLFLKNFVAANPAKSMYGFTLNRKRPGHFSLCFLANKNSAVQNWVCILWSQINIMLNMYDTAREGGP